MKRIKKEVTHQGIGGKEFIIDDAVTKTLNPSEIWKQCDQGNRACINFVIRRDDFDPLDDRDLTFPYKLYYVKVDGLGYIIAEDEIETILEPGDIDLPKTDSNPNSGSGSASAVAEAIVPIMADNSQMDLSNFMIGVGDLKNIDINKSMVSKNYMSGGMQ